MKAIARDFPSDDSFWRGLHDGWAFVWWPGIAFLNIEAAVFTPTPVAGLNALCGPAAALFFIWQLRRGRFDRLLTAFGFPAPSQIRNREGEA